MFWRAKAFSKLECRWRHVGVGRIVDVTSPVTAVERRAIMLSSSGRIRKLSLAFWSSASLVPPGRR
jgi:hypothetical protein